MSEHTPTEDGLIKAKCLSCGSQMIQLQLDPETQRQVKAYGVLLETAQEMLNVLFRNPGGKLWPTEEEYNRMMVVWNQRINKAKARP